MDNLYDRIKKLCDDNGVKPSKMCIDIGTSKSMMSELKSGRKKTITGEMARKIADYFGVSVDYILFGEEKEKPTTDEGDELADLLERLKNRPECRMLFQLADNATADDVRQAVRIIEALRKED